MAAGDATRAKRIARLKAKKPVRSEYRVFLSDAAIEGLREARQSVLAAQSGLLASSEQTQALAQARLSEAEERLEKATATAAADSELLVFEGLSRVEFQTLLDEHQPTDEQRGVGKNYNPETFPPVLIAATCVEPGFADADEVVEVMSGWNVVEQESVFLAALGTCTLTRVADLGKGFAATRS